MGGRWARGWVAGTVGLGWWAMSCAAPAIPEPVSEPVPEVLYSRAEVMGEETPAGNVKRARNWGVILGNPVLREALVVWRIEGEERVRVSGEELLAASEQGPVLVYEVGEGCLGWTYYEQLRLPEVLREVAGVPYFEVRMTENRGGTAAREVAGWWADQMEGVEDPELQDWSRRVWGVYPWNAKRGDHRTEEPTPRQYARRVVEGGEGWLEALLFTSGPSLVVLEDGRVPDVDGHPAVVVGVPPEILPEGLRDFQRTWLASAAKSLGLPEGYEVEWGEPTPEELEAGRTITAALLAYLGLSGRPVEARIGRDQEGTGGGRWDER